MIHRQNFHFPDVVRVHESRTLFSFQDHRRRPRRILIIIVGESLHEARGGSFSTFCVFPAPVHSYFFQVIQVRAIIPEPSAPEKCFYRSKLGPAFRKWSKRAISSTYEWAGCRNKECLFAHLFSQGSNMNVCTRSLACLCLVCCTFIFVHLYLASTPTDTLVYKPSNASAPHKTPAHTHLHTHTHTPVVWRMTQ